MAGERPADRLAVVAAVALAALFAAGLGRLFQLRFGAGDVYPPYSTLRADPLGAKALHDSLAEAGLTVRRSYRPVPEAPGAGATLVLLGVPPAQAGRAPRALADALEAAAEDGARVVLCLRPAPAPSRKSSSETDQAPADREGGAGAEEERPAAVEPDQQEEHSTEPAEPWDPTLRSVSLGERWGFSLEFSSLPDPSDGPLRALREPGIDGLPEALPWRSALALGELEEGWRVLYTVAGSPVAAERTLGAGTLVVATDAYLTSNEALWRERHPAFLAWLVGTGAPVVFDEAHLGVVEAPGVAALARRLGVHGALPALLLLFLLFAWKRASPLGGAAKPPASSPLPTEGADARDAAAGLENLLRRSIPRHQLLAACLREWERTGAPRGPAGEASRRRVRAAYAANQGKNPVETYRRLCRALAERRGFGPEEPPTTATRGQP